MKILLIEDDKDLAREIYEVFTDYGLDVIIGSSWEKRFDYANYQFLIFDLMLLGSQGLEICKKLKEQKGIPIIVMSSVCDVNTKVKWFRMGVDDFLVKPFSTKELLARTLAIMRRYKDRLKNVLQFDDIVLEKKEGRVFVRNKAVELTKIELELLELLIKHQEEVLPKEYLLEKVWGGKKERKNSRTLDVYIYRLRKKLGDKGKHLKTLTNVGYILTRNV
ncbi:MAG: response regulator transcription factor [Desulfurobacteriaceae bacterium]